MARLKQSSGASNRLGSRKGQSRQSSDGIPNPLTVVGGAIGTIAALIVVLMYFGMDDGSTTGSAQGNVNPLRKKKTVPSLDNVHNAIARDIIKSLDCENLSLNTTTTDSYGGGYENEEGVGEGGEEAEAVRRRRRRRLQEEEEEGGGGGVQLDDDVSQLEKEMGKDGMNDDWGGGGWDSTPTYNGIHLMCLAAGTERVEKGIDKDAFNCDARNSRREALLNVWSSARANQIPLDVIKKSLEMASETSKSLANTQIYLWAPRDDESVDYYITGLDGDDSSVKNLDSVLGNGRLYVDIGSGLGLSVLAVATLYPGTTILSVEPAGPSWMLQRINVVCNLPLSSKKLPTSVLAGVGPARNDGMGKMMWRPSSTGTTRAWTPISEKKDEDIELIVRLRTLRSVLAEAAAEEDVESDTPKSVVLNIDCEGCEYNLIPAMSDEEFNAIDTIIGTTGVHWGYIPKDKLPSSKRGLKTHERLCSHYDFARQSIECCAFPDIKVKNTSHNDGDNNGEQSMKTVSELLGDLCDGFKAWADEKQLYASNDDYGWSEMSSMAGMD